MSELQICLTNSQADFLDLCLSKVCFNPLFVAGPMAGKSFVLGLVAGIFVQHSKSANIYIYAPEHHHIRTIEVPNVIYWLDQLKIKHKGYNSHENMIKIESPNCGNIYFKTMDSPSTSYVGYESYIALIDELDTLTIEKADEVYKYVALRNRQQLDDVAEEYRTIEESTGKSVCMNKIMTFTTPEGFNFCYQTWEMNDNPDYQIVRGRTADNPKCTEKYLQSVRDRFPAHIAEKYLNGFFVNMQSLSVYFNYNPELHDSFEEMNPSENLYIGCDFNVENTAATVFVKRDGGKEWHAVDELHGVRDAATLAQLIYDKWAKQGHHITMYPDCSGVNRSNADASSASAIQELRNKGFTIRANNKNFPVEDRISAANNAFMHCKVRVNQRKCPQTSRCLINQAYDKNGKPDKKSGYDHQNDATTYPIVYEMGIRPRLFKIDYSFAQKR